MIKATHLKRAGHWSGPAVDTVVLTYHDRHRRRMTMTGIGGLSFVLDLEKVTVLEDGDALVLDDNRRVAVKAAPEALLEITCNDPADLSRMAWHLGNRHLPTQIDAARILIRDDHVIADMLRGLGAQVHRIDEPFTPEGGAYGEGGSGHHHHDDDEGHHHHG